MILNDNNKIHISKELESIQISSDVQIFTASLKRSSQYQLASCMFAVFTLFLISFFLVFMLHLDALKLLQIQLLIFFSFYIFLEKFKNYFIKFLPKYYKHQIASQNANRLFQDLKDEISRKKILFFVSYDEKYAEILVDDEITDVIPNSHWQGILNEFTQDTHELGISKAYEKAILACSSILIEKFPLTNELA